MLENSICQCSPLPCAQDGKQHRNAGLQPGSHETLARSTLSVPIFPSQRLCHILSERHFRHSREPAASWMSSSNSGSRLGVSGCAPIMLIERSVLPLGDGCVRLLEETARCCYHMDVLSPDRCWAIFLCLSSEASLSGMSMEPCSHKSSSGQDFRYLHHCHTFSALTQKQNSFP